jgi:hypothetical protein
VVKRYRFDYILIKLSEDNNAIRVVCYIEDFEVDSGVKTAIEALPANVNNDEGIRIKLLSIIHHYEKVCIVYSSH